MTDKQIHQFIDWLGELYLNFQNENKQYEEITRKEIKDKIKSFKQ